MKERSFVPALHAFLDTIRERKPATPLLLVSPIACPTVEDHVADGARGHYVGVLDGAAELRPEASRRDGIRELVADVAASVARRRREPAPSDGLALFGEADVADLPTASIPTRLYARIGERFAELAFGAGGAFAKLGAQPPNTGRPRANGASPDAS
jgi:hypothetical protein